MAGLPLARPGILALVWTQAEKLLFRFFLALDQLCCVFPEYYSMLYDSVLRRPSQFYQLSH